MNKEVYEYISKKSDDLIVEWKSCRVSGKEFAIFQSDKEFYNKITPIFNGAQYPIPLPTLCPDLRHMRRMCFRNDRSLYYTKCSATGKDTLSMFAPDTPYTVYDRNYWW